MLQEKELELRGNVYQVVSQQSHEIIDDILLDFQILRTQKVNVIISNSKDSEPNLQRFTDKVLIFLELRKQRRTKEANAFSGARISPKFCLALAAVTRSLLIILCENWGGGGEHPSTARVGVRIWLVSFMK